jgi:hypothetical protein
MLMLRFGFYLPDAEFLRDPEGLVRYLVCPVLGWAGRMRR